MPPEQDKLWIITKTDKALVVTCNDVEVVNHVFADVPNDKCVPSWSQEAGKVKFQKQDTGTDQAKLKGFIFYYYLKSEDDNAVQ